MVHQSCACGGANEQVGIPDIKTRGDALNEANLP